MNSDNVMIQYHALGLLYHLRKQDRLAITKLFSKLTKMSLKSPYAVCLLIRMACKMIAEELGGESFARLNKVEFDKITIIFQDSYTKFSSPYFEFGESCLRHKSEMVIYEAAHAIVNMKRTTIRKMCLSSSFFAQVRNQRSGTFFYKKVTFLMFDNKPQVCCCAYSRPL